MTDDDLRLMRIFTEQVELALDTPVPAVEAKRHTGQVLTCELLDQSSVGAGWDT